MENNMTSTTLLRVLAIFLILSSGLAGCRSNSPENSVNEIRIGVIASITGNIPVVGKSTVEAAEMAVQEVNDDGGLEVAGRKYKVTIIIEDDQDSSEAAVAAAEKLINQQNVVVLIGPQASRNAIPVSNIAENSRIPMISPWSTNPDTTAGKQYVFRAAFIDPFQGQVMARFTFEELDATKAAVLYDVASPYNRGIAEIYKQVFEAAGGQVVAFESYTTGEQDFTKQIQKIKDSNAEVLYLPNYENEVPRQAELARKMGLDIPIIGSDAWGTIPPENRTWLEGAYFSTHYAADIADEPARTFIENYTKNYNHTPDDVAALTYDAFGLLFQAIKSQGNFDPEAIQTGLAGIESFTGVTGIMQYRGTGDPVKSAVVLRVLNGEFNFYKLATP
jgi:branched-chain amino acid transport system substrate-binding protein